MSGGTKTGSYTLLDLQNSMSVSVTSDAGVPNHAKLQIDAAAATTRPAYFSLVPHFIGNVCHFTVGKSDCNVNYDFVNGTTYVLKLLITVGTTSSQKTISFTYHEILTTVSSASIGDINNKSVGDTLTIDLMLANKYVDPSKVTFLFEELDVSPDDNFESLSAFQPEFGYISGGQYTSGPNTLTTDKAYRGAVAVEWDSGFSTTAIVSGKLYMIAKPIITKVVALDIQVDGGHDGVGDTAVFAEGDTALTVTLADAGYVDYKPTTVTFDFYAAAGGAISDSCTMPFSKGNYIFEIPLSKLNTAAKVLMDGIQYTVKATANFALDGNIFTRSSALSSEPFMFTQDVAPVDVLTVNNTWHLASGGTPTDNVANFNASPELCISGWFSKSPQFGAGYSKNLDSSAADTKFKIQYKKHTDAVWIDVKKCSIVAAGLTAANLTDGVIAASNGLAAAAASNLTDGKVSNVAGDSRIIFCIPQIQTSGALAFIETDQMDVQVTIDVSSNFWKAGSNVSAASPTASLWMVNKIRTYNYAVGGAAGNEAEPFNSVGDEKLLVTVDGKISSVSKSAIISDSNLASITQVRTGWTVRKPLVGVGGKVNLYFYSNTSSPLAIDNSFTTSQETGLGIFALINQTAGAAIYPFFAAYTPPPASPAINQWYTSKFVYLPSTDGLPLTRDEDVLLYTGTDDSSLYPGVRRVKCELLPYAPKEDNKSVGTLSSLDEFVVAVSLHTDSVQYQKFDFTLLEAGVNAVSTSPTGVGASLGIVMNLSNLLLNIPVANQSEYFKSSKVVSQGETYSFDKLKAVVIPVTPVADTPIGYEFSYSITDPNNSNIVVWGLPKNTTVPNKYFPLATDYTVAFKGFTTRNNEGSSSIKFDITLAPSSVDRIDGVNVYLKPLNKAKVLIGTYTASATNVVIEDLDTKVSLWGAWETAEISFVAFRDSLVNTKLTRLESGVSAKMVGTIDKDRKSVV